MSKARRLTRDDDATPISWDAVSVRGRTGNLIPAGSPRRVEAAAGDVDHVAQMEAVEREAFGKGYAQGEREGFDAGQRQADAIIGRMAETLQGLDGLRRSMIHHTEQQMVQLAVTIAKRILRREVTLDEEITLAMVRVALDRLDKATTATVRLHPDDYAMAVGTNKNDWSGGNVTVEADAGIDRGGCQIESPFGTIDASVDAQFAEVATAVLGQAPPESSSAVSSVGVSSEPPTPPQTDRGPAATPSSSEPHGEVASVDATPEPRTPLQSDRGPVTTPSASPSEEVVASTSPEPQFVAPTESLE